MKPDKWVRLRDGRGGSLGLQYEAYYEIDRLRAELAALQVEHDSVVLGWQNHDRTQKAELAEAKARIAELEAWKATCQEVDCYRVSDARAELTSPAGPDGRNLAVLYCMERAEEDVKLLREALEGMIAVAEGRFDGNPHADIDALAKARAALAPSPAGREE